MKKYYLVIIDSDENYYSCAKLFKAKNEKILRKYLNKSFASDQHIRIILEVNYEDKYVRKHIMAAVSPECKMYSDYEEI